MKKNNAKNNVTREDALSIRNMTDAEFQQWYKSLYTNPEDAESEEVNDKLSDDFTAFDEPMKEPESSKNKSNDAFADLIASSEEDKTNTDEIEEFAGGFEDINEPDASDDTFELDSDSEQDNLSDEDENPFAGGFEDIDEPDTSELESESEQDEIEEFAGGFEDINEPDTSDDTSELDSDSEQGGFSDGTYFVGGFELDPHDLTEEELEDMVTESWDDLSDDEEEPEVSPEGLNDMGGFFENTNPIKVKVEPDATNSDDVYVSLSDLIRIITVIVNGLNKK